MLDTLGTYRFFVYEGVDESITWFQLDGISSHGESGHVIDEIYNIFCKLHMPYVSYFKYEGDWDLSNYSYMSASLRECMDLGYKVHHDPDALKRFQQLKKKKDEALAYGKGGST